MMKNHVRRTLKVPKLEKWPHDVANGERFEIIDWFEAPEAAEFAATSNGFENPAAENMIAFQLKIASVEEGCGHELYQNLRLNTDTLAEHLSQQPGIMALPTNMLIDATLNTLSWFNPYGDGNGLAYSTRDRARFDFAPPIVNFPFDPGPLTFLFEQFATFDLCRRVTGGFKWSDKAIMSFRRLNLWPYDYDLSSYNLVWAAFPKDIRLSLQAGFVDLDDLEALIERTDADLIAKGRKSDDGAFKRIHGMSRRPFAETTVSLVRSGLVRE